MSKPNPFMSMLANLSAQTPLDLDPILFDAPPRIGQGVAQTAPTFPPSEALWARREDLVSYIGIRVREPIKAPHVMAANAAAAALEREVIPVFLSYDGACDMQRFGFRVEHISGDTAEVCARQEEEIRRFWNLAIIVDAADVAMMG